VAIALSKIPGIDVNKPDSSGLTPLIIAIQYNPGVIEALSKIPGIDVNKPGPSGLTPLRIAIINKSFRAQSALLVAGAKE
jgi:ankyrin repeat protein